MGVPRVDQASSSGTTAEPREADPSWWLDQARLLVAKWRKENSPDEDEALVCAREAYLQCISLDDHSGNDIKVQAQVELARLDFVVGDPSSSRSGLARLSEALREYPYSKHIEEVIYSMAIHAAFPSKRQAEASARGALEYLEYLRDSYAPASQGAPTATMHPQWDPTEEIETYSQQSGGTSLAGESWNCKGLQVAGLPAWALQFQIGLLAFRLRNSSRGMEAMENAFTSYETWLPRSHGYSNNDAPDIDAIRKAWYSGVPHWTAWVQHPRTWLDLGDIAYRQGAGCFRVACEAYKGALERAGDLLPLKQQESIAYRIAKCYSRCGDKAGAIASIERLLYTQNFWSDRYRNHLKVWSEAWREHFVDEDAASLRIQCFWRATVAKMELHFLSAQDRLVVEYTELKRRSILKHSFRTILQHCRERQRISSLATTIQCMFRVHRARAAAATLRSVRDLREAIVQAHAFKLVQNFKVVCWKHWLHYHELARLDKAAAKIQALLRGAKARAMVRSLLAARNSRDLLDQVVEQMQQKCTLRRCMRRLAKQVVIGRRERAATTIQAMARGVVGRELASDERIRQARISELLLNSLRRLGLPVLRQWYMAAHHIRRVRMATKIQARWRTSRARREWALTKKKIMRAHRMGIEAIGRNQQAEKRRMVETWKRVVLERKVVIVQGVARVWLARRAASRRRTRQDKARVLFKRVMKPTYRQCFVALARNRTMRNKKKKAGAIAIQCWWRCYLAVDQMRRLREYRDAIQNAYEIVGSNHETRLLARCCCEWRENVPKQRAATKIEAAWRGREGRLIAARLKDREIRFEGFAKVLEAVHRGMVCQKAFEEWGMVAWLSKAMTTVSAWYRGHRARDLFAKRLSVLRAQQDSLCRVAVAKKRRYLIVALGVWGDHCRRSEAFALFQARIRGWLARRKLATISSFARGATQILILGSIRNHLQLDAKCCTGQAVWRGALAREGYQHVLARARVMGEISARFRDARRRQHLKVTMSVWRSTWLKERRAAVLLQASVRGRRDRARACSLRASERRRSGLVVSFQQEARRRRMLGFFRAIEASLVEAYAAKLRSFLADEKQEEANRGPGATSPTRGGYAWEFGPSDTQGDPDHVLPVLGGSRSPQPQDLTPYCLLDKQEFEGTGEDITDEVAREVGKTHAPRRQRPKQKLSKTASQSPVVEHLTRRGTKTEGSGFLREGGTKGVPRRRHPVGHDIVWEEKRQDGGTCPTMTSALWTSTRMTALERSTDFGSSAFFRAVDEVRRVGLLRWLPVQLSHQELFFLCRHARAIILDPAPLVEVWNLVVMLRKILDQDCVDDADMTAPPIQLPCLPAGRTRRPVVMLCNGERLGDAESNVGQKTGEAMAALVDGGADTMPYPLCSRLSATACSLGNGGAMAIAKACCRGRLEELCLDDCRIGNAGATALALALGEGREIVDSKRLRKLVLSGNRIGGVAACARALRNVITRRSIEVLDISRCSITDDDMLVLRKGFEDTRCRLRVLQLSGNVDLRDRGAEALAQTLRARSEMSSRVHQRSLQVDVRGCSLNTWGCLALAAFVLEVGFGEPGDEAGSATVSLNLGNNHIKDTGVEAMSCAALGQDYEDHRKRQNQALRQKHHRSRPPKDREARPFQSLKAFKVHQPDCEKRGHREPVDCRSDLPPLTGTPLHAAATAAWLDSSIQGNRTKACSVVLDGNRASARVVEGQCALAGLGEAALFRGCVLPETVVANRSWARDSFWTKTGQKNASVSGGKVS